jgi:hypothetical protein
MGEGSAPLRSVPQDAFAYDNRPLPIGDGQTIPSPTRRITADRRRFPTGADGTGSGYEAAVLAELVAKVYDRDHRAARQARSKAPADWDYATSKCASATATAAARPLDAIVVTAAPGSVPQPLVDDSGPRQDGDPRRRIEVQQLLLVQEAVAAPRPGHLAVGSCPDASANDTGHGKMKARRLLVDKLFFDLQSSPPWVKSTGATGEGSDRYPLKPEVRSGERDTVFPRRGSIPTFCASIRRRRNARDRISEEGAQRRRRIRGAIQPWLSSSASTRQPRAAHHPRLEA